jgi:hypothetical protein
MYSMTPNFLESVLDMTIQNTQNFTLISNLWKELEKCSQKKLFGKNFCKLVYSIEEENPQFCTLFGLKLFC